MKIVLLVIVIFLMGVSLALGLILNHYKIAEKGFGISLILVTCAWGSLLLSCVVDSLKKFL